MRSAVLSCLGILGIALSATATASAAEWQAQRTFDTKIAAAKSGSILVRGDNGDLHFIAADTDAIAIHIRIRTHDLGSLESLTSSVVTPHRSGNNFEFDARCGSGRWFFGYTNACEIDETITYPRDMGVSLEWVNGDINVQNPRGDVTAHLTNGDVIVNDASQSLVLSARHGDVVASLAPGWHGKSIALDVSEGDVVVKVPPKFDAYLDAGVRMGDISNRAGLPTNARNASSVAVHAHAVLGDVTIKNRI